MEYLENDQALDDSAEGSYKAGIGGCLQLPLELHEGTSPDSKWLKIAELPPLMLEHSLDKLHIEDPRQQFYRSPKGVGWPPAKQVTLSLASPLDISWSPSSAKRPKLSRLCEALSLM